MLENTYNYFEFMSDYPLKKAKDRVTLLGCSGHHRLPLVFINKSAKPRCFKHMDISTPPVH